VVLGTAVTVRWSWAQLRFCVEWFEVPELLLGPGRIPVGCEVIDCCPGCPGGPVEEIEWRIRLESPAGLSAGLRFSGLPGEPSKTLTVEGAGKWNADQTVTVERGQTTIRGFKLPVGQRPPVVSLSWRLDEKPGRSGKGGAADMVPDGAEPPKVNLEIAQLLGRYVVGRVRRGLILVRCPNLGPGGATDAVRVVNNASADQTVILLDGKRGGSCVNDEVQRTAVQVGVGNFLSKGTCREEAIVFSDDDAMQLRENLSTWTNPAGDLLRVDQTPDIVNVPLHLWHMDGSVWVTGMRMANDMARANQLYNTMNCGISFTRTYHDAVLAAVTAGLRDADCGSAALLRSNIGFVAGAINVYYLRDPSGMRGWWCGNNTIIIGSTADNETLSHELGHAFTLDHTNEVAGMSATNLMVGGGTGRNNITEGQCFRCNANGDSTLNTNGNRVGPTRTCADGTADAACPALSLDVAPN
jgi:hypothetical protein